MVDSRVERMDSHMVDAKVEWLVGMSVDTTVDLSVKQ